MARDYTRYVSGNSLFQQLRKIMSDRMAAALGAPSLRTTQSR